MTPLRQKMIDVMLVRGMSPRTHRSYLNAVTDLAKHYRRSPDQIERRRTAGLFPVHGQRASAITGHLPIIVKCVPIFI